MFLWWAPFFTHKTMEEFILEDLTWQRGELRWWAQPQLPRVEAPAGVTNGNELAGVTTASGFLEDDQVAVL